MFMDVIYRHSVSYHILISYIEVKLKHCYLEADDGNSWWQSHLTSYSSLQAVQNTTLWQPQVGKCSPENMSQWQPQVFFPTISKNQTDVFRFWMPLFNNIPLIHTTCQSLFLLSNHIPATTHVAKQYRQWMFYKYVIVRIGVICVYQFLFTEITSFYHSFWMKPPGHMI